METNYSFTQDPRDFDTGVRWHQIEYYGLGLIARFRVSYDWYTITSIKVYIYTTTSRLGVGLGLGLGLRLGVITVNNRVWG